MPFLPPIAPTPATIDPAPGEPYASDAQRRVGAAWRDTLDGRPPAGLPATVRLPIRTSWLRSVDAGVDAALALAPAALDATRLAQARDATSWLGAVQEAARPFASSPEAAAHHVLALFDASGHLLALDGDPAAVDGLAEINFAPGSLWSESAVGTNGPGTALATGTPIHVVGAEHYCARWHRWHCAAVPVRDPVDGRVLGVVDISGAREHAHPHTLVLAGVVALAVEQWLRARDAARRVALMEQLDELSRRYPGDALVAIDRSGALVARRGGWPSRLDADRWPATALRAVLPRARASDGRVGPLILDDGTPVPGVLHPLAGPPGSEVDGVLLLTGPTARRGPAVPGGRPGLALRARRTTHYTLSDLLGASPPIEDVRRFVQAAGRSQLPVLLTGESGTGKEVVAQSIHAASSRAHEPFVAVNCAAIPRELVESELFGHVAGAFSGARRDGAVGRFEAAHRGTLFLDEIGELPAAAQAALLRVLQEGEVTRLGAHEPRAVDVRVIAATNRDVADAVRDGLLREDLYYRLAVLTAAMPSLRDRREDVPELAHAFLRDAEREHGIGGHDLAPSLVECLQAHRWPGNVRELRNLMRRVVALAESRLLGPELLPAAMREGARRVLGGVVARDVRGAARPGPAPEGLPPREPSGALTVRAIEEALERSATVADAARCLGVSRATLYRALSRHGLASARGVRPR
jgi:transcriptional regulator of acetoin/glycerol metabolism